MLARLDETSGKGELGAVGGKWKRGQRIDAGLARSDGDARVAFGVERHMSECLLAALVRVDAVEIERQQIKELKLLVILKQMFFRDPCRRLEILASSALSLS